MFPTGYVMLRLCQAQRKQIQLERMQIYNKGTCGNVWSPCGLAVQVHVFKNAPLS
jgi:hypothetical protein